MDKIFKCIVVLFLIAPSIANASIIYMEPVNGAYGPGDTFAVDVLLDVEGVCVNTVSAAVVFPNDYLSIIDFIEGESIVNIWLDKPDKEKIAKANGAGELLFAGGIPGGYCGRIPGDPGKSNLVARIIFSIPNLIVSDVERESVKISFKDGSKLLLNDGFGTEDSFTAVGAEYKVLKAPTTQSKEWQNQIKDDNIKPEPFIIELRRDADMFDNRFYINFYTIDKQSGIDRYEVLEIAPDQELGTVPKQSLIDRILGRKPAVSAWKKAMLPHVLNDQDLESVIKVRAIDKAGNERYVEYIPSDELKAGVEKKSLLSVPSYIALVIAVLAIILIVILLMRRKQHVEKIKEE